MVPLRAKAVSKNWDIEMDCFKNMLDSVLSQTDDSFHLVLVCHDIPPNFDTHLPNVSVLSLDTPIPENLNEQMKDKAIKKKIGLDYIMEIAGENSYVMLLDADDIVCNRLSDFVKKNSGPAGWYFAKGYRYSYSTGKIIPAQSFFGKKRFDETCGSSTIVKLNSNTSEIILRAHNVIEKHCRESGYPLKELPFRGAIHVLDTGNNHSRQVNYKKKYVIKIVLYNFIMSVTSVFTKNEYENFPILKRLLESKGINSIR